MTDSVCQDEVHPRAREATAIDSEPNQRFESEECNNQLLLDTLSPFGEPTVFDLQTGSLARSSIQAPASVSAAGGHRLRSSSDSSAVERLVKATGGACLSSASTPDTEEQQQLRMPWPAAKLAASRGRGNLGTDATCMSSSTSSDGEGTDSTQHAGVSTTNHTISTAASMLRQTQQFQQAAMDVASRPPLPVPNHAAGSVMREKKTKKTESQKAMLLKYYGQDIKPPKNVIAKVAAETSLTVDEVNNWFRNRRNRHPVRNINAQQDGRGGHLTSPVNPRGMQHASWPEPADLSPALSQHAQWEIQQLQLQQRGFGQRLEPESFPPRHVGQEQSHFLWNPTPASCAHPVNGSTALPSPSNTLCGQPANPFSKPSELSRSFPQASPRDVLNRASEIAQGNGMHGSGVAAPGCSSGAMLSHIPPPLPSPADECSRRHGQLGSTPPTPLSHNPPASNGHFGSYVSNTSLAPDCFVSVFQRFGANSPERQSMLAQLAPILSMEEQQLLRGELHNSAGGYNLDHLPHSLHGKASLAWNEISKIFAANSSNSHRRLTKRSSSASQDSGCVPSDTDLDTSSGGGGGGGGGGSSGTSLTGSLGSMQVDQGVSGDSSHREGGQPASLQQQQQQQQALQMSPLATLEVVWPSIVAGLALMLKQHSSYVRPVLQALNSMGVSTSDTLHIEGAASAGSYKTEELESLVARWSSAQPSVPQPSNLLGPARSVNNLQHEQAVAMFGMAPLPIANMGPEDMHTMEPLASLPSASPHLPEASAQWTASMQPRQSS